MQRRSGLARGLARISIPSQSRLTGMGVDPARSRWQQRWFGVPSRIWALLVGFVSLVAVSRQVLSYHRQLQPINTSGLVPINYLSSPNYFPGNNSAADPSSSPFLFCGSADDTVKKYGGAALAQTRLHLGSGGRVHRVIHKALLGQPITMSVLGGSVSACHGAGDDPLSPLCYPSLFFQWWLSVFPHPASELTNGAMRRTDSGYFSFCSAHHVPEDTDLVILEFDVDDPADQKGMENFELLVRSLLDRPDQPAVVILGHFSPQVHAVYGFAGPEHWHTIVAQFYDVPHVSVKPILYPTYMTDPDLISPYYADPILANPEGHVLIADVLISYFQSQVCATWATAGGHSYEAISPGFSAGFNGDPHLFGGIGLRKGGAPPELPKDGDENAAAEKKPAQAPTLDSRPENVYPELGIPPVRINTRPEEAKTFTEPVPYCASANDLVNPVPPSLFYGSGWHAAHPDTGASPLLTAEYYWHSWMPKSKLRVPIKVGAGDVGIYYLKEPIRDVKQGSQVECWVDDNYGGAAILENAGNVDAPVSTLEFIDHYVTPGNHFVECATLGEEGQTIPSFKIIGIFAT